MAALPVPQARSVDLSTQACAVTSTQATTSPPTGKQGPFVEKNEVERIEQCGKALNGLLYTNAITAEKVFGRLAAGEKEVRVGTGAMERLVDVFSHVLPQNHKDVPLGHLVLEYMGGIKELYGQDYVLELAEEQAKVLRDEGYYVFAHGQSLSYAFWAEIVQYIRTRTAAGSIIGERVMHMRLPNAGKDYPAASKALFDQFKCHQIHDHAKTWADALLSVDRIWQNRLDCESSYHFFTKCHWIEQFDDFNSVQTEIAAQLRPRKAATTAKQLIASLWEKAFSPYNDKGMGRYYVMAVDPSVMEDETSGFVYLCGGHGRPYNCPCQQDSNNPCSSREFITKADLLKPDFDTFLSFHTDYQSNNQARFIMKGYDYYLSLGKVRVFVYDAMNYAQRKQFESCVNNIPEVLQVATPAQPPVTTVPASTASATAHTATG